MLRLTERFKNGPSSKSVEPLDGTSFLHFWFSAFLLPFMEGLLRKYIGMVLILNGHYRPCRDLNVPEISFPAGAGTPKVAKHIFHERQQTKSAKMLFRLAVLRFC